MAGTIVDSLVIELGLDPANMTKGARKSVSELRRLEAAADDTGRHVSLAGTHAAEFFTKMSAAALGFFGVLTAGRGLKAFIADTVSSNAALGRMAHNVGMSASRLSQWQSVAQATGASASDVNSAMTSLAQQFQTVDGRTNLGLTFGQMGAHLATARDGMIDVNRSMLNLADTMSHMDPQRAQAFGAMLGFSPDMVNVLQRGSAELERMMRLRKQFAPTDRDIRAAQQLQEDWSLTTYQAAAFGRTLLTNVEPEMHELLQYFSHLLTKYGPEVLAKITDEFHHWGDAIQRIDWKRFGAETEHFLGVLGADAEKLLRLLDRVAQLTGAGDSNDAGIPGLLGGDNSPYPMGGALGNSAELRNSNYQATHGLFGRSYALQDEDAYTGADKAQRDNYMQQLEDHYGIPKGLLSAIWGQESTYGHNTGPSSAGALGDFQIVPENFKRAGIDPRNFFQSAEWVARNLATNRRQLGNWDAAIAAEDWRPSAVAQSQKKYGTGWFGADPLIPGETRKYLHDIHARMAGQSTLDIAGQRYIASLNKNTQAAIAAGGSGGVTNSSETHFHGVTLNIRSNDPQGVRREIQNMFSDPRLLAAQSGLGMQ